MHLQSFQLVAIAPPMGASGPNQLAFFLVPLYTPPLNLVQIGVTLGGPWDKRDGPTDRRTLPFLGQPPGTNLGLAKISRVGFRLQ